MIAQLRRQTQHRPGPPSSAPQGQRMTFCPRKFRPLSGPLLGPKIPKKDLGLLWSYEVASSACNKLSSDGFGVDVCIRMIRGSSYRFKHIWDPSQFSLTLGSSNMATHVMLYRVLRPVEAKHEQVVKKAGNLMAAAAAGVPDSSSLELEIVAKPPMCRRGVGE